MKKTLSLSIGFAAVAALLGATATDEAEAYPKYDNDAVSGDQYCAAAGCHGGFRSANPYISPKGDNWGDSLHNLHYNDLLGGNGECQTCHTGNNKSPQFIGSSDGASNGLRGLSCMGCHGRTQDDNADNDGNGGIMNGKLGTALRQHHYRAGKTVCVGCHADSDPATYTPVGEAVLPEFYVGWHDGPPGKGTILYSLVPTDSCNSDGSENLSGPTTGIDNDGDNAYDGVDSDCSQASLNGTYYVKFSHSGDCLEVDSTNSTENGTNVQQAACSSIDRQQWKFIRKSDGTYRIRSRHSNKCIRAAGGLAWGDAGNGANIQQGNCKWRRSKWFVMPLGTTDGSGNPEYVMRSRRTGQCAQVAGAASGTANLEQWGCEGGDEQRIILVPTN